MSDRDARARARAGTLAGAAVAIVIGLVALQLFRGRVGDSDARTPIPTSSIEIPQAKMHCSETKCVAALARQYAATLEDRPDDAKHVLLAAEALERNDCNTAIDERNLVKGDPDLEGASFTGELMNVCLLGGDLDPRGDAAMFQQDDDVAGDDRVRIDLELPDGVLESIGRQAARLHHSISWVVVEAWRLGKEDVTKLPPLPPGGDAGARSPSVVGPQAVYVPARVAKEIDAEAARTSRPREALIERAWTSAAARIAKMDAAPEPDGG